MPPGAEKWLNREQRVVPFAFHSKTKHVEIFFHNIREQINDLKTLAVKYCQTAHMLADPFTKCLPTPQFKKLFGTIFGSDKATGLIGPNHPETLSEQGGC